MNKRIVGRTATLIFSVIIVGITLQKIYLYTYVLRDAPEYPSDVMSDMVVYKIDPVTILASLGKGNINAFMPALKDPVYDDVPLLWTPGSFSWHQEDYLKIANSLHQFVWNESLEDWHLYTAHFRIFQCKDISRIDAANFGFYQRQGNSYYVVHNISIDLGYGFVYAGNDNGYYTGKWRDLDFDNVTVNNADKALLRAQQNGGQEALLAMRDDKECNIDILFAPFAVDHSDWGWRITYWYDTSRIFGVIIDPYSDKYKILDMNE